MVKVLMKSNKFGSGNICSPDDIKGSVYITCAACMTVYSETTGWANKHKNKIVDNPEQADNIIVLSCQVTDLAILNDITIAEKFQNQYPTKKCYVGGCLAQRFDIELPDGILRVDHLREDYQPLVDRTLINYEYPFWVPDFKEDGSEVADGHIFRDMYPLRVGSGCHGKCKYCTIKITRGQAYELDPVKLEDEFKNNDNIVIIADSVTPDQIRKFGGFAEKYNKSISFRNVEPQNVVRAKDTLYALAEMGLLNVLHTPVQATSPKTLKVMNRSKTQVEKVMDIVERLKDLGVYTATNIIIDYDGCDNDFQEIYDLFDYVSWNPYWAGSFDIDIAKDRWIKYIGPFN